MSPVKDLVSVIVPTHNRAQFLVPALHSILNQSYALIEIIVVANGCVDETENVVSAVKSHHQIPIIFIHFAEVLGAAKARNIGIDKARGEYISFLDDDDTWHPDKLKTQIQLLCQKQVAIVGTNFFYAYGESHQYKAAGKLKSSRLALNDLYYENNLGSFSFCLTKKIYIGQSRINEDLEALQDLDLWFKILQNTELSAYISPAYHVYFRLGGSRISNSYPQVIRAQKHFLACWKQTLDKPSIDYHQMRIRCFEIKIEQSNRVYHYIVHLGWIIKAIFHSPSRYNIKKYLHYLAMPIVDIDALRIWLWQKNNP